MSRYALIDNNVVSNIIEIVADADYTPPAGLTLIPIAADAQCDIGWVSDGVTISAPVTPIPSLAALKAALIAATADRRYAVETGGITVNGVAVDTSLDSQNRITSVVANAASAGVTEVDFKAGAGWLHLTMEQVVAIAAAIGLHVQACYTAEKVHDTAIDALETIETAQAYDITTGWPS